MMQFWVSGIATYYNASRYGAIVAHGKNSVKCWLFGAGICVHHSGIMTFISWTNGDRPLYTRIINTPSGQKGFPDGQLFRSASIDVVVASSSSPGDPCGAFECGVIMRARVKAQQGHHSDANNLGLIYMNARYYMPEIGRFISPDTIVPEPGNPQSYNRYAYVQNSPVNYIDPTGHNRDCGMGDPICNGDRSVMAGGWGSVSQQAIADPIEDYYSTGYKYTSGEPGERSNAVRGGTVHNGVDLKSDNTHEVVALSTGVVRVADSCAIDPCNGAATPAANWGTGSVVIVEYPYQVIPDQVREDFGMTSDMSMYVQYQHLDEISSSIVAGRAVTANDAIGQ
ncbi:MAG TPA: RHS repeat-associated core domain-containing protein [Promineifilum sp.]|nr:RHS repeat-associated core domain-containing protein [Promineifilum sp.]